MHSDVGDIGRSSLEARDYSGVEHLGCQEILQIQNACPPKNRSGHYQLLQIHICERAIRNFTIGRKNWLFSASPKGAAASAAVYSIVETSKANGLEPFRYLTYLFDLSI